MKEIAINKIKSLNLKEIINLYYFIEGYSNILLTHTHTSHGAITKTSALFAGLQVSACGAVCVTC